MKYTKKQLQTAIEAARAMIKPLEDEFDQTVRSMEAGVNAMFTEHYDAECLDQNGRYLRPGDTVTDGECEYEIESRQMQIVFDTPLMNTEAKLRRISNDPEELVYFILVPAAELRTYRLVRRKEVAV